MSRRGSQPRTADQGPSAQDPHDRLLDQALERVLSDAEAGASHGLTDRIVGAWERGEEPALSSETTPPALTPAGRPPEPASAGRHPARHRPKRAAAWFVPAAAAAAAGLTFFGVRELLEQRTAPMGRAAIELAHTTPPSSPTSPTSPAPTPPTTPPADTHANPHPTDTAADRVALTDPPPLTGSTPLLEVEPAALEAEELEEFGEIFRAVVIGAEPTWNPGLDYKRPIPPFGKLAAFGKRSPGHWAMVRERIREAFDGPASLVWMRGRMLDYLGSDPRSAAYDLGRELWMRDPAAFGDRHLVSFAERGAFEFEREIFALVAHYQDLDERKPPVLPAAYLGLRGWPEGRDVLESTSDEFEPLQWQTRLAAAAALEALGESDAWMRLMDVLRTRVEEEIAKNRVEEAAWFVRGLEFFDGAMAEPTPRLALLDWGAAEHFANGEKLLEPEAVRQLLERVTDG